MRTGEVESVFGRKARESGPHARVGALLYRNVWVMRGSNSIYEQGDSRIASQKGRFATIWIECARAGPTSVDERGELIAH